MKLITQASRTRRWWFALLVRERKSCWCKKTRENCYQFSNVIRLKPTSHEFPQLRLFQLLGRKNRIILWPQKWANWFRSFCWSPLRRWFAATTFARSAPARAGRRFRCSSTARRWSCKPCSGNGACRRVSSPGTTSCSTSTWRKTTSKSSTWFRDSRFKKYLSRRTRFEASHQVGKSPLSRGSRPPLHRAAVLILTPAALPLHTKITERRAKVQSQELCACIWCKKDIKPSAWVVNKILLPHHWGLSSIYC